MERPERPAVPEGGLCDGCAHAQVIVSAKGSRFILCGLAATDGAFAKYPRLPVLTCAGFSHAKSGEIPRNMNPGNPYF